jgi:hypothetical protein
MKIKSRHIILLSATIAVLIGAWLIINHFTNKSTYPYPSLAKQRAALINKPAVNAPRVLDSAKIINDLIFLASDSCEGRARGSAGHELAVQRILTRMREAGLDSFNTSLVDSFQGKYVNKYQPGKNVIGWIKGTRHPEKYIVISAHYDHLGIINGAVYHGASDNASGTACLLAMAKYFKQNPLGYSLIFAAFDREETGMQGSLHFVNNLPSGLDLSSIKFNLNIDMIARNDRNEIFVCGLFQNPSFLYAVTEIQNKTKAKILMGHDTGNMQDDWTDQSDHFAFYKKNIPFLYIGVEDHEDYHQPTDTYDKINFSSYIENCNMVALFAKMIKL